ncbi:MAG: diguanylate cyclase [Desulfobulbales bacterium]|nr:diguanylate cyclase [Desulfobulbales bacterium]
MLQIPPSLRISLGLVLITLSVVLLGNFIGLIPDRSIVAMQARKTAAESLAVQCTLAARDNNIAAVKKTMDVIVSSQPDILSLGLRGVDGSYLTQSDKHQTSWVAPPGNESTATHWQVPIYNGNSPWGVLEISFASLYSFSVLGYPMNPFYVLLIFFAGVSFIGFFIFLKRTLRYLDPTEVMPSRVKTLLDTLTEGVIIIDTNENIILVNSAFAKELKRSAESLMGLKISELPWIDNETKMPYKSNPWTHAITEKQAQMNKHICLNTETNNFRTYQANFSPIVDDKGNCRGALATFEDVTALEILATQDPLTGCLNRRSFFTRAAEQFKENQANKTPISCIMVDIDLFKSINDTYGHAVGDVVIQEFANILLSSIKGTDLLCRYGGEEFCITLPQCRLDVAGEIAERTRSKIEKRCIMYAPAGLEISITSSFGVSSSELGADSLHELIEQADKALYMAKNKGRNRVIKSESLKKNMPVQHSMGQAQVR